MIYQGKAVTVKPLEDGIVELNFNNESESVNKFDKQTVSELGEAAAALHADSSIKGMIVTSGKRPCWI